MEPAFIVVGVNHTTVPAEVRDRFRITEAGRRQALTELLLGEGVEEVMVLATGERTDFLLWASDPTLAANSVLQFLTARHGLRLSEWKYFYRLLDEAALVHILRVACSLGRLPEGESHLLDAWQQAQSMGCTSRYLNGALKNAISLSQRARMLGYGAAECEKATAKVGELLQAEAHESQQNIATSPPLSAIFAIRQRLDQMCRQELDSFRNECGPFTRDQEQIMERATGRLTKKIAGTLIRELRELPEKVQQEQMMAAMERLFHLAGPELTLRNNT